MRWLVLTLLFVGCDIQLVGPVKPPVVIDDAPIKQAGNRCLIVYESADLKSLPVGQLTQLTSTVLRKYLNEHCAKVGNQPEWRMLDPQTEFTGGDDAIWAEAIKLVDGTLPRIVISDGRTGFVGPLPASMDETLILLRKYFEEAKK